MDHKKDIGSLFKQKLDGAVKEPDTALWDKIEVSLDKRDRKKRGFFFFWVGSGTAAIIFLLLFLNNSTTENQDTDTVVQKTEVATETLKEIVANSELNSEKNNTIIIADSTAETPLNQGEQNEPNELVSSENKSVSLKTKTAKQNNVVQEKDPFKDDSVTIKTTYHYYNGDTKEMLETTDKGVIDSLLERTKINIDSLKVVETKILNPYKKDSLHNPN